MKKYLIIVLVTFLTASAWAQTKPVKIVFDITSKDESAHQSTMRHVKFMSAAYPASEFEIVIYGGALPMALKNSSTVTEDMKLLESHKNVTVIVCEGTMKRFEVDKTQLLPGVITVPDGILEIVLKQSEGWAYIKETSN